VIDYIGASDDEPLATAPDYSTAELRFLCSVEHVVHITDLILRRTSFAFVGRATQELIDECSRVMAPVLGWGEDERIAEIEHALHTLASEHPVPGKLVGAGAR
jgi:glycerol-3-phosphate dehydrogenase